MHNQRELVCSPENLLFLQSQMSSYFKKATGEVLSYQKNLEETVINFLESSRQTIKWGKPESLHVFNYMFLAKIIPLLVTEWEMRQVESHNNSAYHRDIALQDRRQFHINHPVKKNVRKRDDVDSMPFPEISDNRTGMDIKTNPRFPDSEFRNY